MCGTIITASLERAFIYTGIACILQATIGHRLPLMEGSAGLWWGVILSLAASTQAAGQSLTVLGGTLEAGIILTGLIIILLGATGLGWWLRLLFTLVHGRKSSRLTRRSGITTIRNTTTPTANARTGDIAQRKCCVGCWDAHFLKRSSHGHCTPLSLRTIWIDMDI